MLVVSSNYNLGNAMLNLVQAYFRGASSGPLMGKTKKEEEARDNKNFGYRNGLAEAISEMLTIERAKKFPLMDRQVKVMMHEVIAVLRKAEGDIAWAGQVPDGDIASQIVDRVLALIDGVHEGDYARQYEDFRRHKIRLGEIQAGPEDREWIEAEAEKKRREVDEILGLLGPASEA